MSQANIGEELRKAAVEPLLPIEKKLIGWSLGIGVGPARRPRHRQPPVPGVDLTPSHYDGADRAAEK